MQKQNLDRQTICVKNSAGGDGVYVGAEAAPTQVAIAETRQWRKF